MANTKVGEIDVKSIKEATKEYLKLTAELAKANKASNNLNASLSKKSSKTHLVNIETKAVGNSANSSKDNLSSKDYKTISYRALADSEFTKNYNDAEDVIGNIQDGAAGFLLGKFLTLQGAPGAAIVENSMDVMSFGEAVGIVGTNSYSQKVYDRWRAGTFNYYDNQKDNKNLEELIQDKESLDGIISGQKMELAASIARLEEVNKRKNNVTDGGSFYRLDSMEDPLAPALNEDLTKFVLKNKDNQILELNDKIAYLNDSIHHHEQQKLLVEDKIANFQKDATPEVTKATDNLVKNNVEQERINNSSAKTLVLLQQQCDCTEDLIESRRLEREEAERLAEIARQQQEIEQGRANAAGIVADWNFSQLSEKDKIGFQEENALNSIDQSFQNELAWENNNRFENGLDPLSEDDAELLERYRIYEEAKTAIKQQATAQRHALEQQEANQQRAFLQQGLASMDSALNGLMSMAENARGKQSGTYKALFAVSKAFAVADATLNFHVAVSRAFGEGQTMAERFANVAAAIAQGVKLVSAVQSVTMSGQAHAGIDYIPREGTWLLDRGERVVDSRTNADLKSYLKQQTSHSGGNSISVNVPVSIQNQDSSNGGMSSDDVTLLANMIRSQVYDIVSNEQRPGGLLNRRA